MNYHKAYTALRFGDRLPRKIKKEILGKKISKTKLKAKLKYISDSEQSLFEMWNNDNSFNPFCPICGCEVSYTIHHSVEYPEVWNEDFCGRCGNKVGCQDNSKPYHVLELEDFCFD